MAPGEAFSTLRRARRLRGLPVTTAAFLDGRLSVGAVRIIVANVSQRSASLFADHEAELIPTLVELDLDQLTIAMRTWADLAADALDDPSSPEPEPASRVQLSTLLGGTWHLAPGRPPGAPRRRDPRHRPAPGRRGTGTGRGRAPAQRLRAPERGPGRHLPVLPRAALPSRGQPPPPARQRGGRGQRLGADQGGGSAPTGWSSTGSRWPRWSATRCCTRSWWPARPSWITAPPPAQCRPTCSTPWWSVTATAASPAVTARPAGATPTTWCMWPRAGPPARRTWCCGPAPPPPPAPPGVVGRAASGSRVGGPRPGRAGAGQYRPTASPPAPAGAVRAGVVSVKEVLPARERPRRAQRPAPVPGRGGGRRTRACPPGPAPARRRLARCRPGR